MNEAPVSDFKARIKRSAVPFVVLSFLAHGLMYSSVYLAPGRSLEAPTLVEMDLIEVPQKKEIPRDVQDLRLADQDKLNEDKDEKAKFLSSHNQRVEKQTVAQKHGEFKNINKKGPEGDSASSQPAPNKWAKFMPQFDVSKNVKDLSEREQRFQDGDMILPSAQSPTRQAGTDVSQTLDYIKELDPGLETMLSTKEFKYYTFFTRVRKQLNQHWTPKIRSKVDQIYKQGRRIASTDDMITNCLVTLDHNGRLLRIQIIGVSGVRELDEAATEAFRAAAPFPNPPKGMVDPDGTIKIQWRFVLET